MTTLDDLEALVQHALAEGARHAEVLHARGEGRAIALAPGGRPQSRRTATDALTVRVWVDGGRSGRMRGPWSERRELVGQALASTFESPEDPHAGPVGKLGNPASALGIADRRHDQLTDSDRLEALTDAERQIKATDGRFASAGFSYEDERIWRGYASSRGTRMEETGTRYRLEGSLSGQGLALREHLEGRAFATVASIPLGVQLARRAGELLRGGTALPAGPVRVVLPPLPMARLLAALGEHFRPDLLAGDGFFLQPDGHARRRLSEKLHVVDDGSAPGGLRTRAFDDRGVPPVPLTLLREGRVEGRFLDPETARLHDTRPTGHCREDGLGPNNLVMRAGSRSVNALLTELGGPSLMIDDLPDLSGFDPRTGAFAATVDGVVMNANVAVGAMRRVRLTGNLLDLFAGIVEVCSDADRIGHVDAAAMIADGLVLG